MTATTIPTTNAPIIRGRAVRKHASLAAFTSICTLKAIFQHLTDPQKDLYGEVRRRREELIGTMEGGDKLDKFNH